MFRAAFGLRSQSMHNGTAWTSRWAQRTFNSTKSGIGEVQIQQQQSRRLYLHSLQGTTRTPTSRPGLTLARSQRRGFRFSSWRRHTTQNGTQENLSLSQKLKRLSKEYGWSAVGVYLALSVLDFPFCKVEHYVVSSVSQFIPQIIRQTWHEYWHSKNTEVETLGNDEISDKAEMAGWGVAEAQQHHKEEASTYITSQHGSNL
ncbi:hypothetical protein E4U42_000431 [Claviceps africana]|uniref:DUF1279 domain-containing protein n=1 Tax=Claviceps africana TaxID=83212 RepID=A0A8K0NIG0_9HYPO|nr:hypothetical protein E4U42_000431 [Claviceps africana]